MRSLCKSTLAFVKHSMALLLFGVSVESSDWFANSQRSASSLLVWTNIWGGNVIGKEMEWSGLGSVRLLINNYHSLSAAVRIGYVSNKICAL